MKKKILFCIENFQHGGITKALENIISVIDINRYDIGLFVVNQEDGPYKTLFTPYLKYPSDSLLQSYCTYLSKYSGLKKCSLMVLKAVRKLLAKFGYDPFISKLGKYVEKIEKDRYDCVIAYAEGYITKFVSQIEGYKVAWIHIDYKRYLDYAGNPDERDIYRKYNHIVIPGEFSRQAFAEVFPEFNEKVCVIPNAVNSSLVMRRITPPENELVKLFKTEAFTIISVGRICYEKQFFKIPEIAKTLRDKGAIFRWYIIGGGSDAETDILVKAIENSGMEDSVILLGWKDNPYPYIAQSDILVCTSLSETFSYVVFEAKSLGVPVVCSDFGTAPEILDESEGIITPLETMADGIYSLYANPEKLKELANNLKNYEYNNRVVLDKFDRITQNDVSLNNGE